MADLCVCSENPVFLHGNRARKQIKSPKCICICANAFAHCKCICARALLHFRGVALLRFIEKTQHFQHIPRKQHIYIPHLPSSFFPPPSSLRHSLCGRVPAFSGGPRGRPKPQRPVYKILTCCQINVYQISLRNTHIKVQREWA